MAEKSNQDPPTNRELIINLACSVTAVGGGIAMWPMALSGAGVGAAAVGVASLGLSFYGGPYLNKLIDKHLVDKTDRDDGIGNGLNSDSSEPADTFSERPEVQTLHRLHVREVSTAVESVVGNRIDSRRPDKPIPDLENASRSTVGELLDGDLEPVELKAAQPAPVVEAAPLEAAQPATEKTFSFGSRDRSEPEEPMGGFLDGLLSSPEDELFVVRSSTPNSPHYITEEAGKHTYDKSEAARFSFAEAERLARDYSHQAASKGYGYSYQTEEAEPVLAQQLHFGASLSK